MLDLCCDKLPCQINSSEKLNYCICDLKNGVKPEEASQLAERIRAAIEQHRFCQDDGVDILDVIMIVNIILGSN